LRPHFLKLATSNKLSLFGVPGTPPLDVYLQRNFDNASRNALPLLVNGLKEEISHLKEAYRSVTGGKFNEALTKFTDILAALPMIVVDSRKEVKEVKDMVDICREYITGIKLEIHRRKLQSEKGDLLRIAELAAYFTHCNIENVHLILSLRSAINVCLKLKNYETAHSFTNRLLDLNPRQDIMKWSKKVLRFCEQNQLKEEKKNELR